MKKLLIRSKRVSSLIFLIIFLNNLSLSLKETESLLIFKTMIKDFDIESSWNFLNIVLLISFSCAGHPLITSLADGSTLVKYVYIIIIKPDCSGSKLLHYSFRQNFKLEVMC